MPDIQSVENFIEGLDGVASVGFTNKEQALEKFRSSTTSDIIDTLDGQNPLPRSIDVELSDPQLVEQVADAIRGNSTYQQIIGYDTPEQSLKYGQQTVDRLFTLTNYVRYIGIALVALLIFIAMVFINNTIRLASGSAARKSPSCASWARRTAHPAGPSSWKARCTPSSARFWRWAALSFCARSRCRSCRARSCSSTST